MIEPRAQDFTRVSGSKRGRLGRHWAALLAGAVLILPASLQAQTAEQSSDDTTLKPIVLSGDGSAVGPDKSIVAKETRTSSKTDTPLLDAPASVSVVTEQELEERGVETLDEALSYTPGVSADIYGSDNRYDHYLIRGFYSTGLSTYRDGLPLHISNFTGSRLEPYGMQRIEILKGANSTLFGLSQPGGIVNAVSKRPQDVDFGEVYTTLGDGHVETGTDFGGPIDPDGVWSYRLTAKWQNADQGIGYSEDDRVYIAPALTFSPAADTDFTLLTSYNKRDGSTSHGIPYQSGIGPNTYLGEPDFDNMDTIERNIGYEFRHDFGNGLEFRQNARYTDLDMTYESVYAGAGGVEAGRAALAVYGQSKRFDIDNQLQYDTSFNRFDSRTLFGITYEHEKTRERRLDGYLPGIDPDNPVYTGVNSITFYPESVTNSTQSVKSVYLQEELTLDKRWILTLGGRYDYVDTISRSGSSTICAEDKAFTSRAGLTFKATEEVSVFANYAESFQPLDANRTYLVSSAKPQEGRQYEIGVKYQPEGTDALFTASAFDLTQENISQWNDTYTAQYQIGEVNVRGIELEGKLALTDKLDLIAAYSYWDAEIKDDVTAALIGKRPKLVPEHIASLWASYTLPGNGIIGDVTFGMGARFIGKTFADDTNTIELPSRTVFDAAVKYKVSDNVTLAVNATNLFDKKYVSHVDTYSNTAYYGDRRTVRATLSYNW